MNRSTTTLPLLLAVLSLRIFAQAPAFSPAPNSTGTNIYRIDLSAALRLADSRNLDVQIARQLLAEARAGRDAAIEQFFPWLAPGVQFRRRDGLGQAVPSGIVSEGHFQSYAPGANLSAQLTLGDAIYNALAAKQNLRASGHALEAQRLESGVTAAQRYFDLAKAHTLVDVAREALRISRSYQDQLHEAVGAGIAFRGDELRVQTQTERYEVALRQAVERERTSGAALALTLHLDPAVELLPDDDGLAPLTLVPPESPLDSLVQQALQSRPEFQQYQALILAADESRKGATWGPLIPSLNAQMFAGGFGGGPDHLPDQFGAAEDYSVSLGWRIGPGGLFDFGRINTTKARLQTALLRFEKLRDEITRQVVETRTVAQSFADQLPILKRNLSTASETLNLARERKEFGVGIVLEDIQAQQELTRARSEYLSAIAEYNKAQYALARALGQLSVSTNRPQE